MKGSVADQPLPRAVILDLRGLTCPLPVLKTKKRLSALKPGARVAVRTTDPLAAIDIPAFCAESGHRLVERQPEPGGGDLFLIERG